jgi:hypothetical protein
MDGFRLQPLEMGEHRRHVSLLSFQPTRSDLRMPRGPPWGPALKNLPPD